MLVTVIWGSTFVIAKDVLAHWPPLAYIGVRFLIAAVALVVIFPKQVAGASRGSISRSIIAVPLLLRTSPFTPIKQRPRTEALRLNIIP